MAKTKPAAKKKTAPKKETPVMIGYKGFDKDFKCRDMQYAIGKTFTVESASLCKHGLHFCENPFDVWGYYPPANGALNRFALVEASGVDEKTDSDSKRAATTLKVKAEIGLPGLIKAGVEYIIEKAKDNKTEDTGDQSAATNTGYRSAATNTGYQSAATNTGDQSAATNTGPRSAATNTGDQSAATNTGDQSAAKVEGKESVAISLGIKGKASGEKGCWLVLAEWGRVNNEWHRKDVKSIQVDGETIKANVFYALRDGEFVEAGE